MPFRTQFACLLAMLFAMLVGVSAYQYCHPNQGRKDISEPSTDVEKFANAEMDRQEKLSRFEGAVLIRIKTRRQIVDDLAAGRMGLFEAAAKFKRLNSEPNPGQINVLRFFRGTTDNERVCWQVITWLDSATHQMSSSQRQVVLAQAEAELREHMACNGGNVTLPED
jgi:hypothetical protein